VRQTCCTTKKKENISVSCAMRANERGREDTGVMLGGKALCFANGGFREKKSPCGQPETTGKMTQTEEYKLDGTPLAEHGRN